MKKLIMVIVLALVVVATARIFVVAEECIKPPTIDANTVPFDFDANNIPARLVSWMQIDANSTYSSEIRACDPDGDPITIEPVLMPAGATWDVLTGRSGTWTWTPDPNQLGNHWFVFTVTDMPPDDLNSLSDTAAYLVNVVRVENQPPVLLPFAEP